MSSFSHLTCQEALSILQYFTSRIDYIHFIQTTKKFRFVLEMFNSNPISLFEAKGLFTNISTQNLFTKKDRKIPGMKKYILWYDVNYTRYLKELEHKNTICKHVLYTKEERIKYGNNIPSGVNKIGSRCMSYVVTLMS
ncbi:leucine rich repeatcontaining protein BspA family protein [Entamoeba histolytica KU27]|uniref:Leucine rich repeatcontaining protein BspA family protein n=1 Tax=Entamoeba histolytica KU27 TaxID=885311 RepID=M2QFN6_ENTHI|nr:leucine rich repeatcontaining protein BspA family protein [Entamoeba histolytica KU27]